jgi:hypothetical protein
LEGGGELILMSMSDGPPDLGEFGSCGTTAMLLRLAWGSRAGPKGLLGAGCNSVLIVLDQVLRRAPCAGIGNVVPGRCMIRLLITEQGVVNSWVYASCTVTAPARLEVCALELEAVDGAFSEM